MKQSKAPGIRLLRERGDCLIVVFSWQTLLQEVDDQLLLDFVPRNVVDHAASSRNQLQIGSPPDCEPG